MSRRIEHHRAKPGLLWSALLVTLFLATAFPGTVVFAAAADADEPVDIVAVVTELQVQSPANDKLTLAMWMPPEYWTVVFGADPSISAEDAAEIVSVLEPYLVLAVVDGELSPLGSANFVSRETIYESTRIFDSKNRAYAPLKEEAISADANNFASMMKPTLENMLGPLGQNMYFLFFPSKDKEGTRIAAPTESGRFAIQVGDEDMAWRLPIGALLPPKTCPEDGESLSGAWSYCPWHGKALESRRAAAPAKEAATSE